MAGWPFGSTSGNRERELERQCAALRLRVAELEARLPEDAVLALPPPALRARIGGFEDADHFLGVGRKIFWDLKRLLGDVSADLAGCGSVLDFGCGCGRVIRHFDGRGVRQVTGVDIDPEAIAWCRGHLGRVAEFHVTGHAPPLPFSADSFDLVFVVSVFTHLPEEMQFAWLGELRRVIRPGGLLIASVHAPELLPADLAESRASLLRDGFLYIAGGGTPGLPDFYQNAWHTRDYLEREWARFLQPLHYRPRAINNHQDAVVCRKA